MKGGFNKILRNVVAGSSDTEFEKVIATIITTILTSSLETLQGHILIGLQGTEGEACYL